MLKCTINGKTIEVEKGTTIIQAFYKIKDDIAHYCWHPGLSIAGVCRLCMIEVEGNPKLQIACNTLVEDGMAISNQSPMVKEAVRWGLEFHMINHPLDCPICDQAGECILQDQYMKFGKYDPLMAENKVKKRKVVDLGSKIVLDTERCILCARCTRFTDEISKTKELGIFNRGDRSEIGVFKDKPLENDYAHNTVDICPVGALTSKTFRFQQRVWYLKEEPSICTGCSTGCHVTLFYNEEGIWRIKPRYNKDINQHWMCDKGRETYQHVNRKERLNKSFKHTSSETKKFKTLEALSQIQNTLIQENPHLDQVGLVLTGQYTIEEYKSFIPFFKKTFNSKNIFYWKNNPDSFDFFDEFLIRGDKNPNTYGLMKILKEENLTFQSLDDLTKKITNKSVQTLIVCGPENQNLFPQMEQQLKIFLECSLVVWISSKSHPLLKQPKNTVWTIPSRTYFEKSGTFLNHNGKEQKIRAIGTIINQACSLSEIASAMMNENKISLKKEKTIYQDLKENHFLKTKGAL